MKIIKRASLLALILLFPLSLMAMAPVSEDALSGVTGQAGVNINADMRMNLSMGTMAWGDSDGVGVLTAYGWDNIQTGGYVGVNSFNITNLRIKARETDTFNGYAAPAMLKPITIDVATDYTLVVNGGYTFVRIGLGSLQISMDSMSMAVGLGEKSGSTVNLSQILGTANLGNMNVYINPESFVDIYNSRPGSRRGITMTMNITLDRLDMDYLSWGDTDGCANTGIGSQIWMSPLATSAGYIGLSNLVIGGPITIAGTVLIDINTSYAGIYAHGTVGTTPGAAPVSVVHIGFPSAFNITVNGPITAEVKLDGIAGLNSANAGTLGDIYMSGLGMTINPGSWVDIWAH